MAHYQSGGDSSSGPPSFVILNSGKPRSGKSTALNNVFGVDFTSKCSAFSVTKHHEVCRLIHGSSSIVVVDTPGIGADDVNMDDILHNLRSSFGGLDFVLVLCHSVCPGSTIASSDRDMIKGLQRVFGKDVWKKCVVLFTFSDTLRSEHFPRERDRGAYRSYLRKHVGKVSSWLKRECGSHVPDMKLVFDSEQRQTGNVSHIVAVPVGRELREDREEHNLLPGLEMGSNWKHVALVEIMRKVNPVYSDKLYGNIISKVRGTSSSALIGGATAGAVITLAASSGFFGVVAAAGVMVAGGLLGGVSVPVYRAADDVVTKRNRKRKLEQLLKSDPQEMDDEVENAVQPLLFAKRVKSEPRDPD